ncbi:MAG: DUF3307 domain-containing protein [Ginsengibacter sp.]
MEESTLWIIKLILAHLLTDFLLQPSNWIIKRKLNHFGAIELYMHGLVTGIIAWIFIGWQYWMIALIIMISHIIIDGWKSYQKDNLTIFIIDQFLHLAVIFGCWLFTFFYWDNIQLTFQHWSTNVAFWKMATAIVFLTMPSGILIGKMTNHWRENISDSESLANAGKWIGIVERIIILIFVLYNQYSAIGLLVAAKGIIRFNEKDRPEIKTEYLVIGTLLSIAIAIVTGLLIKINL